MRWRGILGGGWCRQCCRVGHASFALAYARSGLCLGLSQERYGSEEKRERRRDEPAHDVSQQRPQFEAEGDLSHDSAMRAESGLRPG